ncbi:coiled-coil domain-containing protein 107 [Pelobates fuscus]|uniref:coiled-coil domain-containing protein 107 n=1 Tax=Pelobates fuscus TaxID=191477 RepID=UPI002FE46C13
MALSFSQQMMLSVSLALCACVLLPRLFGGKGDGNMKPDPRKMVPVNSRPPREMHDQGHMQIERPDTKSYPDIKHLKHAMEKEMKAEKMNSSGRSFAFTLMPLYTIGVAVFAAYKFTKIKTKEKNQSQSEKEADKKSKETETQLVQLEQHLSQTEQMLNSLLTQLDPLSNCVNTLASGQRDDIMNQLQSIRQLMKKSGMDRTSLDNKTCEDAIEELILSFNEQEKDLYERVDEEEEEEENDEQSLEPEGTSLMQYDISEPSNLNTAVDSSELEGHREFDIMPGQESSVLRKRNKKE